MKVSIKEFSYEQKLWYAHLLAKACIMDKKLQKSEIGFVLKAFYFLEEKDQEKIREMVEKNAIPNHLVETVPKGMNINILGSILSEITHILASDGELKTTEKRFLRELKDIFDYSDQFLSELLEWAEKVTQLERLRSRLVVRFIDEKERSERRINGLKK